MTSAPDLTVSPDVQSFIRCICYADSWTIQDLLEFLEKPQHWSREYAQWEDAGKPYDGGSKGFGKFATALVEEE